MHLKGERKMKIALLLLIAVFFFGCTNETQLEYKEGIVSEGEPQITLNEPNLIQPDNGEEDKAPFMQNPPLEVISSRAEVRYFCNLFEHDNMLYVVRYGKGMYKMNLDGSRKELFNDDKELFGALFIDSIAYYYSNDETYLINESKKHQIMQKSELGTYDAILVDGYVYYYYYIRSLDFAGGIYRIKMDDSRLVEQVYKENPNSIQISDGWIYYRQSQSNGEGSSRSSKESIHKIDLQGKNKTLVYDFAESETIVVGDGEDDFFIDGDWLHYEYNSGVNGRYNMETGEKYEYVDETDNTRISLVHPVDG